MQTNPRKIHGFKHILALLLTGACGTAFGAAAPGVAAPDNAALASAMRNYLAEHGDFCVGKYDWPIDVSEGDAKAHTNNAVQMPVLEKMGLVRAENGSARRLVGETEKEVAVKRYFLTAAGQKYYVKRSMASATSAGDKREHPGDFCAGKLSLDRVVEWEQPKLVAGHAETTVTYTYRIAPADWTRDPDARRVFPMVAQVVTGAGQLRLKQRVRQQDQNWVAVNLWE